MDIWASKDGATWTELMPPASPPWNAGSIMTFGGDRERFGLPSEVNAFLIDNDVWRLAPVK
jgi:hypothetical protein